MFGEKAKRIQYLEATIQNLQTTIEQMGGGDALHLQEYIAQLESQRIQSEVQLASQKAQAEAEAARAHAAAQQAYNDRERFLEERKQLEGEIGKLRAIYSATAEMVDSGYTEYTHPALSSIELGEQLQAVREDIKKCIRDKTATRATTGFTFNNSAAKGRKFVSDMSKMMLRAYNAECENCMLTVKAGNGETARNRLERARDQVAKLGTMIDLEITHHYHQLRLRELDLTLRYQNAKKAEKEAEKEERARLREEKKVQQELAAAKEKLEKERLHYLNVLTQLKEQGNDEEAAKIQEMLNEVGAKIEDVDYRAANTRAGYVYVISNIGAFGPGIVKIGMTRRLEPMDRINELGDASVPFGFDVHALFFSNDAVGVETELHHRFADARVNQVNLRREFFYTTPVEVREALKEIDGNLLDFVEEPEAEQYRLSQQIRAQRKG